MAGTDDTPGALGIIQARQRVAVDICRAVYGGTLLLRENEAYLPKWEREEKDSYDVRLEQAVLFNAFKKTAKSLTGIVYRDPPTLGEG